MKFKNTILDFYTDYLIIQNDKATATGLSQMTNGAISHDKVTRSLKKEQLTSKELWKYVKPSTRQQENGTQNVLTLDDTIEEKPYKKKYYIRLVAKAQKTDFYVLI